MVFSNCDCRAAGVEVYVSCLEIYQEKLKDLLDSAAGGANKARGLRIRETGKLGVWIEV